MKTRSDYVSNSSSCSFVIAVYKSYKLDDLIDDIAKGCLLHREDEDNAKYVAAMATANKSTLKQHWKSSECLFLGKLDTKAVQQNTYKLGDPAFERMKNLVKKFPKMPDDLNVIEDKEDSITFEIKQSPVDCPSIPIDAANKLAGNADKIFEAAKKIAEETAHTIHTAVVTSRTLQNTRALLAAGHDLKLDSWIDLDKFEKMLGEDEHILILKVSCGGDDKADDTIFALGGWDGVDIFADISGVQVLNTELV